jgi:hypothetical protein
MHAPYRLSASKGLCSPQHGSVAVTKDGVLGIPSARQNVKVLVVVQQHQEEAERSRSLVK